MMPGTVIFLGAGATKACGGPLTNEILPKILSYTTSPDPGGHLQMLGRFLEDQFHITPTSAADLYPGLPMLMSVLDTALDRREPLHPQWGADSIRLIREAIEFGIFDVLEEQLQKAPTNNHWDFLQRLYPPGTQPCVISTNYDLIADTAMMFLSELRTPDGGLPAYHCAISTSFYAGAVTSPFGVLLKLHGSLNWLYCKACHRLEIGASDSRKYLKVLSRLTGPTLEQAFLADGSSCPTCQNKLRPLLIAPTHLKDYRNPHLAQVWYEAERMLRGTTKVIFIGYSLPDDDVEVIYLLKRSLSHLLPGQITVVEFDSMMSSLEKNAVGRRYRTLFGDGIDWHPEGLDGWLSSLPMAPQLSS